MRAACGWDGYGPTTRELADAAALEAPILALLREQGALYVGEALRMLQEQGRVGRRVRISTGTRAFGNLAAAGRVRKVRGGAFELIGGAT